MIQIVGASVRSAYTQNGVLNKVVAKKPAKFQVIKHARPPTTVA